LATGCAKFCPTAFIAVISNPVNSTVPIVAETMKQFGVFDPSKIFGVTTLVLIFSLILRILLVPILLLARLKMLMLLN
jgi:hypothetical protein